MEPCVGFGRVHTHTHIMDVVIVDFAGPFGVGDFELFCVCLANMYVFIACLVGCGFTSTHYSFGYIVSATIIYITTRASFIIARKPSRGIMVARTLRRFGRSGAERMV